MSLFNDIVGRTLLPLGQWELSLYQHASAPAMWLSATAAAAAIGYAPALVRPDFLAGPNLVIPLFYMTTAGLAALCRRALFQQSTIPGAYGMALGVLVFGGATALGMGAQILYNVAGR